MIYNAYAEQKENVLGIRLVSCGHIYAKPGREIKRPNGRNDWLLFYVAKESETFYLNSTVTAEAGSFIIFAPGEKQHHIYNGNKTAEFYYVHFLCDDLPTEWNLKTSQVYKLPFKRKVCDTFETMIEETFKKQPFYEKICLYKLLHLLILFEREIVNLNNPQKEKFDRIAMALLHMNQHYDSNLSLDDYATMCNMSKYHFSRVFQNITGSSPLEYRNHIKLEHAVELLCEDNLSVEEVSVATGYSSASYFSLAFKRRYGVSPKQYRQQKKDS